MGDGGAAGARMICCYTLKMFERRASCAVLCCAKLPNNVRLFVTPWTVACHAPLSMGILWAVILEWVPMPSRGSSQPRDCAQVTCLAGGFLTI